MAARLETVKGSSRLLLEHAGSARATVAANRERARAIGTFLERFQLSDEDKAILDAAARRVDSAAAAPTELEIEEVLRVMERLSTLCARAVQLQRAGNAAVALELRAESGRWDERGQRVLFHWLVARPQQLGAPALDAARAPPPEPPAASGGFARALGALRRCRPLHAACVRELAAARAGVLVEAFSRALTAKGPAGGPRPLEQLAAEPTQYVGAMLAWAHGAAVGERALLAWLCAPQAADAEGAAAEAGVEGDGVPAVTVAEALALALERLGPALELRICGVLDSVGARAAAAAPRATIGGGLGAVAPLAWLGLTIRAHAQRFGALLDAEPAASAGEGGAARPSLVGALLRCADRADAAADAAVGAQLRRLVEAPPTCPPDLACPEQLVEALGGLIELQRALETAHAPEAARRARAAELGERAMAAFARVGESIALEKSRPASALAAVEQSAFRLNCTSALAAVLSAHAAPAAERDDGASVGAWCAEQVRSLRAESTRLLDALVDEQTGALFERIGLAAKLAALHTARAQPGVELATIPTLEPAAMSTLLRSLYALVFTATADGGGGSLAPGCERIADGALRALAVRRVSRNISLAHRSLYEAVSEPRNGYASAEPRVVLHTPAQIDTLLDCEALPREGDAL